MSDIDSTAPDPDASDDEGATPEITTNDARTDLSDEELEQLEKEREERLDPANRPANAEVDNSGREWDSEKEVFKYAAGEEPGATERTSAIIGADRPDGVESDVDEN